VFTVQLPSNDRRDKHTDTQRLMEGIYEGRRSDGLGCHDIHTKFHKDWLAYSKVNGEEDSPTHRQHGDRMSLL
jgi:hypothetical protein